MRKHFTVVISFLHVETYANRSTFVYTLSEWFILYSEVLWETIWVHWSSKTTSVYFGDYSMQWNIWMYTMIMVVTSLSSQLLIFIATSWCRSSFLFVGFLVGLHQWRSQELLEARAILFIQKYLLKNIIFVLVTKKIFLYASSMSPGGHLGLPGGGSGNGLHIIRVVMMLNDIIYMEVGEVTSCLTKAEYLWRFQSETPYSQFACQ